MLVTTHPRDPVLEQLAGTVKYHIGINKAIGRFGSASAVEKYATIQIDTFLKLGCVIGRGSLNGGSALGINIEVLYWIMRL